MDLTEAKDMILNEMKKHKLLGWSFCFNNRRRSLGVCFEFDKRIELSKYHVLADTEEKVKDTILHEIAHALVGSEHRHNIFWQLKAKEIGLTKPTRCSGSQLKGKYAVQCPKCKSEYNFFRKPKHYKVKHIYNCNKCNIPAEWIR